ncbi:acyltransferase family protein [Defluviicoccus vanus]|uniref:Acyltransferase n=1 Tax=Defluviicoccus vanus TaxID=111831 RepID=A0A7H1N0S6_9PROT|nr:acyltransferase [Defluviicoccus vanus]QNT69312.1 acyltransferase [Defluviicoccus vanus]
MYGKQKETVLVNAKSSPSERSTAIDGLRGYAACAVIIYHALLYPIKDHAANYLGNTIWSFSRYDMLGRTLVAIFSGETAVMIFFVMSGAVLMGALDREGHISRLGMLLAKFPIKRISRLYPALIVCLAAMYICYETLRIIFPTIYPAASLRNTIINMTLYDTSVHGATWTLKAEILAIPFIIICFMLKRYLGVFGLVLAAAYSIMIIYFPQWSFGTYYLPRWLIYFVCGFIAYDFSKSRVVNYVMSGWMWVPIVIGAAILRPLLSMQSNIATLIQAFCIMLLVSHLPGKSTSPLSRIFSSKMSVFLGRISYSLYLWNVIFLNVLLVPAVKFTSAKENYVEYGIVIGIVAALLSIPFSIISERWLESSGIPSF